MGRIAAGVLRLLKLESSIGLTTLDQLNNLGMSICKVMSLNAMISRLFKSSLFLLQSKAINQTP